MKYLLISLSLFYILPSFSCETSLELPFSDEDLEKINSYDCRKKIRLRGVFDSDEERLARRKEDTCKCVNDYQDEVFTGTPSSALSENTILNLQAHAKEKVNKVLFSIATDIL